ncbi:hypothetical protein FA09DRAFT_332130 [Tilletiopsis washingtonensis]|jgi:hypothetical protein|uniref:DNA replication regulator SLD2 n=1 Tax=Tilletiopsis washingtonensis TaxID=58919 RepID=A0A316Z140_9BASI|nr:hypothetical protein FA09DRAFT_332130 [Tilletiopsis washingtonensis]PWN95490.1 hypothetical protein FA09DRAFT_332130 [Tilletiopsis washingtonensis]
MAQHPEIADTYNTWSAIRAATSKPAARASASSTSGSKAQRTARASSSRSAGESSRSAASSSALPPVTPTKKRRPAAATPRTPAPPETPKGVAAASARSPFRTPSRPRSAARPAAGETSAAAASTATPGRNPFATPSRNPWATPSRAVPPRTPGSAESVRSVVNYPDLRPSRSPTTPGGGSGGYEAVRSPAALRSLLASRSPGGGSSSRRRVEMARTEAALRVAYTPRTKARKRLRGDEVPPTPARAPKRGRGSETLGVPSGPLVNEAGGSWARTASGSQSLSQQPASPQDEEMFGPSPVKRGPKAYVPLLPSRPSAAVAMEEDSDSEDDDDESGDLVAGPLSSTLRSEARAPGEAGAAPLQDERLATPPRRERIKPRAERQRVELDDDDDEEAEVQELIIRPYQRYGAVRAGLQGEASDDSSSDSDGGAAFSHLRAGERRRRRHGLATATPPPPDSPADISTQQNSDAPGLERLTLASPQTKHARAYVRAREAEALEHLLGGGAETLELEAEQAPVEPEGGSKKAKSWGEAKAREQVSKGKGRKKRYDASPPPERSAAQQRAALEAQAAADAPTKLSRAGRAGVGDAEQTVRRKRVVYAQRVELDSDEEDEESRLQAPDEDGEDEDWASEVSSTEFGLGDGEMEETDII